MFSYWNVAGYDPGDPIRLSKDEFKEMYIAEDAPFDITEFKVKANIRMYGVDVEYPLPETWYKLDDH